MCNVCGLWMEHLSTVTMLQTFQVIPPNIPHLFYDAHQLTLHGLHASGSSPAPEPEAWKTWKRLGFPGTANRTARELPQKRFFWGEGEGLANCRPQYLRLSNPMHELPGGVRMFASPQDSGTYVCVQRPPMHGMGGVDWCLLAVRMSCVRLGHPRLQYVCLRLEPMNQ